jgi:hypothetical protein
MSKVKVRRFSGFGGSRPAFRAAARRSVSAFLYLGVRFRQPIALFGQDRVHVVFGHVRDSHCAKDRLDVFP